MYGCAGAEGPAPNRRKLKHGQTHTGCYVYYLRKLWPLLLTGRSQLSGQPALTLEPVRYAKTKPSKGCLHSLELSSRRWRMDRDNTKAPYIMLPMQPPFHWCVGADGRIALQCGERGDLPPLNLVRSLFSSSDVYSGPCLLSTLKACAIVVPAGPPSAQENARRRPQRARGRVFNIQA